MLYRDPDKPEFLKVGFQCPCAKQIMENGGPEMLDALYKENMLPEAEQFPDFDVTLGIDTSNMGKTSSK